MYHVVYLGVIFFNWFIFREREEREKEKAKHCFVRETSIGCHLHTPLRQMEPMTQASSLIGNRTGNPSLCETMFNQLVPPSMAGSVFYTYNQPCLVDTTEQLFGNKCTYLMELQLLLMAFLSSLLTRVHIMKVEVTKVMNTGKILSMGLILTNIRIFSFQTTIIKAKNSLTKCQITVHIRLCLLWRKQTNKVNVSSL